MFLAALLAPAFYFLTFHVHQQKIHTEMEQRLERELKQTISLNPNDIKWIRNEKEIIIGDRLFDVHEIKYEADGKITVSGLFDDEETILVEQFQKRQQENNSTGNKQIAQILQFDLALPVYPNGLFNDRYIVSGLLFPTISAEPVSIYLNTLTPPPRCFC